MFKLLFTGNLGKDAKIIEKTDFKMIVFSVAVSSKKDETTWIECAYFRRFDQSLAVVDYLKKGAKVLIEGEPSVDVYEGKGNLKARVINLELLGAVSQSGENKTNEVPF